MTGEDYDVAARTRRTMLRYERVRDGRTETVDREWLLHWHTVDGFRALASSRGTRRSTAVLDDDGSPAAPGRDELHGSACGRGT